MKTFEVHQVCGLLGPRQCGKTTLAKYFSESQINTGSIHYFDLEDPSHIAQLENPQLTLEPLEGFIILDEIQRRPNIFPYLRVFVDRYPERKVLVLGSASRDLIQQSSESLAGRIGYVELTPLNLQETKNLDILWKRGGFPRSFLAKTPEASRRWRKNFIRTFLERDIKELGFNISSYDMGRLWSMLAYYHGNIINYSELGRSLGVSDNTIRKYLSLLEETFMIRTLKPWFANIKKRQLKSPKVYIRDSGILHSLLDIEEERISMHPKSGASWEGFALEEMIRFFDAENEECYFWSTQHHAELDLMIRSGEKIHAFEFKYTDSPKITKSMQTALRDLSLEKITIIVPAPIKFRLSETIEVQGLERFFNKYSSFLIILLWVTRSLMYSLYTSLLVPITNLN